MIYVYLNDNEINGYSNEHLERFQSQQENRDLDRLVGHKNFFDFPRKTSSDQKYVFPILLTGEPLKRGRTLLPKDFVFYIPDSVLSDVKSNICKIVFDYSGETYDCTHSNKLDLADHFVKNTMKAYNLEKNHVILLTGNYKAYKQKPYQVCTVFKPAFFIPTATKELSQQHKHNILNKKLRTYKVMSLMRSTRPHRIKFAYDIFYNGLRDGNLITCHLPADKVNFIGRMNFIQELQDKNFFNTLPWTFDDPTSSFVALLNTKKEENLYLDSYFNFVIETFIVPSSATNQQYEMDISEKIFKPISRMQPFVVYGQAGTLEFLKSMGYKTFSSWLDESYDNIQDKDQRYENIFNLFKKINAMPKTELNDMLSEMLPTLEHNQTVYETYVSNKTYLNEFMTILEHSFDK